MNRRAPTGSAGASALPPRAGHAGSSALRLLRERSGGTAAGGQAPLRGSEPLRPAGSGRLPPGRGGAPSAGDDGERRRKLSGPLLCASICQALVVTPCQWALKGVSQQSLGERPLESADSRHGADRVLAREPGLHGHSGTANAHARLVPHACVLCRTYT